MTTIDWTIPQREFADEGVERPWRVRRLTGVHVVLATLLAALGLLATGDAWAEIFEYATADAEYSHILLVPLVSAWLIAVRRARFRHCRASGFLLGPAVVAIGWLAYWWGFNHRTTVLYHIGAVLVPIGCVAAALGKNAILRFFPAVAVLAFLIPVPGQFRQDIAQPLQQWTARIAAGLLDLGGVEVGVSGNAISVGGQSVLIAEACNGMRLVFPLLLLAVAFCFGLPLRNSTRAVLLLLSPLVCLLCNVVRTIPVIWLYGRFGEDSAVPTATHAALNWLMPAVAFLLLYGVLTVMRWAVLPTDHYRLAGRA